MRRARAPRSELEAALARYRPLFGSTPGNGVDDWDGFIDSLMRPPRACIWTNPARIDAPCLAGLIAAEGIDLEPIPWLASGPTGDAFRLPAGFRAGQRWWYCAGLAHAQEEVSQLPVTLMDIVPGQRVLDLCAAPGGKTAQIALAMDNRGTLVANDFAPERIAALQGNLDRLGIVNCSTTRCDGGNYPAASGPFDRILVDAPCSSEGTLRRNQGLTSRIGPERSARMAGRQRALLRKAVQLCRPGGRIVYSTCTFAPEENELIVAEVLDEQAGRVHLVPVQVDGLITRAGLTRWDGRALDPSLAGCLRLWPHLNDTGGFFVAVLEKARDAPSLAFHDPEGAGGRADAPTPEDALWLETTRSHYGIAAEVWQRYRTRRQTRRGLHLMDADHRPPPALPIQGSGLFFHRTNSRPPKLTTGGALLLGAWATRNRLALSAEQRDAYLRRQDISPSPAQTRDCGPGQVLVSYRGHTLGVGVLHRSGTLQSLFPSRWSGCTAGA